LARALRGDLDTIVLKALREDPSERYPTAEALREDVARYLSGEPVKARPDRLAYRAWKFVRRQRVAVGVGVAVATLLLMATHFSLDQARRARAAAEVATQQAERARAVQDLLLGVFMSNSDQQLDPIAARQRTARELLDVGSQRVVEKLSDAPEVLAGLCHTLADMYHQMGLGEDAARMRAQAIAALRKVHGQNHELIAEAYLLKAQDERQAGQLMATLASLGAAEQVLDNVAEGGAQTRAFVWLEAAQIEQYSALSRMRVDAERAREYFEAHTVERMWSNRFQAVNIAARALHFTGELERAELGHVDALRELEVLGLQDTAWSVTPLVWLAETQWQASQLEAAEANLRHALGLSRYINGADNGATVQTQIKLGALLHQTGRREEGRALLHEAEPKLGQAGTNALATWRSFYGTMLLLDGRVSEAETLFSELIAELEERLPQSLLMARARLLRAQARLGAGRQRESLEDSALALQLWAAGAGPLARPSTFASFHVARARAQLASGDVAAAELSVQALEYDDPEAADAVEGSIVRAQVHGARGQWQEAQREASHALARVRAPRLLGRLPQLEAAALQALAEAHTQLGDGEAACTELAQATAIRAQLERPESPWRVNLAHAAAGCEAH
jgi:eukaryotic-like serine/threonine-protein kinase